MRKNLSSSSTAGSSPTLARGPTLRKSRLQPQDSFMQNIVEENLNFDENETGQVKEKSRAQILADRRQYGQLKDIRKARMTLVRQESLDGYGTATVERKKSVQRRVFKNHYISTEKASYEISEAEQVNQSTKLRIQKSKQTAEGLDNEVDRINQQWGKRILSMKKAEPRAPRLRTLERAISRGPRYGGAEGQGGGPHHSRNQTEFELPKFAVKHEQPFNIYTCLKTKQPNHVKSIHDFPADDQANLANSFSQTNAFSNMNFSQIGGSTGGLSKSMGGVGGSRSGRP